MSHEKGWVARAEISENELQEWVMALCTAKNLLVYHTFDSRRSRAGFPDLVIVGGNGVLYRELKANRGYISSSQRLWQQALSEAGQDTAVWRPHHWPGQIMAELGALTPAPMTPPPTKAEVRRKLAAQSRK